MATEALFLMYLVESMEYRKVTTVDVPGLFMQAYMEGEIVHMKLEGKWQNFWKILTQSYIRNTWRTKK